MKILNILLKGVTETIKNETREQKEGFLGSLVGTIRSILLGNLLSGRGIVRAGSGNKKGKRIIRADYGNEWDFLMLPHALTNFKNTEVSLK